MLRKGTLLLIKVLASVLGLALSCQVVELC